MTRKHFEMIAHVVNEGRKGGLFKDEAAAEDFALSFVEPLSRENPRFDYERFMSACGFEPYDPCAAGDCGHYTCTEGGALGYWAGADPRLSGNF